jgi:hypothetical protein
MARWRVKDEEEVPPELVTFDPDDWVLGAGSNPARLRTALTRWHEARFEWVLQDPWKRTIDGDDVITILFEDAG